MKERKGNEFWEIGYIAPTVYYAVGTKHHECRKLFLELLNSYVYFMSPHQEELFFKGNMGFIDHIIKTSLLASRMHSGVNPLH
jgi:hypothetical protein